MQRFQKGGDFMTILCYEKCSTCRKALRWLDEQGADYTVRPVKEENPSYEELLNWWKKSGLPLRRFFNTSGMLYRELGLKDKLDTMSDEEQLRLLASDGMLVKRPLLVSEKAVIPGFREAAWKAVL
jgi:arsenate reductase